MPFLRCFVFLFAACLALPLSVLHAQTRLPHILSDHAVFEHGVPVHIWGWDRPGQTVRVGFHDQQFQTIAGELGNWSLWLMPEPAGGPYALTVEGSSRLERNDIMVGEVWVASGQSNMEFPLKGFPGAPMNDSADEIAHANQPDIRLLQIPESSSTFPVDDTPAQWTACTPAAAANFSAVAYFFAREISRREHMIVGVIQSTWGGTPAEAWISLGGLASITSVSHVLLSREQFAATLAERQVIMARDDRDNLKRKEQGLPPVSHWYPNNESFAISVLFNGMIAPLTPYTIRGAIWYQGESNTSADRAPCYYDLFTGMIDDWRKQWAEGNFPFLFVQISNFHDVGDGWSIVRDAQRRALDRAHTAMAVTLDIGTPDNVHPPDKQTVSHRLALAARAVVYGEPVRYSGPLYRQMTREGSSCRLWFDYAQGLKPSAGNLEGFEIAGPDGVYVPAVVRIDQDTVVVSAASVSNPIKVRYGGASDIDANLVNAEGLPAASFIAP